MPQLKMTWPDCSLNRVQSWTNRCADQLRRHDRAACYPERDNKRRLADPATSQRDGCVRSNRARNQNDGLVRQGYNPAGTNQIIGIVMQNPSTGAQKHDQGMGGLLQRLFAIDVRSLALYRICIGLVLLVDLLTRGSDIQQHYSDLGVLPREALWQLFLLSKWHWSLHALTGSVAGQTALFVFAVMCAVALILGYRTRLATVLSWLLLASLHARNPMLQYGGDHLLRMLLFWSMFLPLGCYWSIDRLRGVVAQGWPGRHLSMASAAILLQIFMLYFFSSLFKRNEIWQGGEGLYLALSTDMFSKPLAHHLLEYPQLLEQASLVVPWFQFLVPFLLFVPWATVWFRTLAILLLAGFHGAIELFLATGMFQYVGLSGLMLFLPSRFWDRLSKGLKPGNTLQAIASAARAQLLAVFRRDARPEPEPRGRWTYGVVQVLVLGLFIYVVSWNIATLKINEYARKNSMSWMSEGPEGRFVPRLMQLDYAVERMFGSFGWIGRIAKLHQHWAMFQWGGGKINGWHVIVGTLSDGREINLLEGGAPFDGVSHRKPYPVVALYSNVRWRIYFRYLRFASSVRDFLPGVISRDWNQQHPDLQITKLRISFILVESGVPSGRTLEPHEFLWYEGPASGVDTHP